MDCGLLESRLDRPDVSDLNANGAAPNGDGFEGAPKTVKESVNKDEAAKIKKMLEDAGAAVEIK